MLFGGGVSNYYVVSVGGRAYVKGRRYMFLPWRHTQCHGEVRPWAALAQAGGTRHESGLGRRRRRRGHLRRRRVGHERLEGVELLLRRRRRRLARGAQAEGRRRVGSGGGRLARRHGAARRHCGLRLNAQLRARLKRGFPSLAAQARALELRGRPDSELLSLATQTSACEVRVCLASPAILVGFLGEDASKPHETHLNRTSSTYLDPPKRGLKF